MHADEVAIQSVNGLVEGALSKMETYITAGKDFFGDDETVVDRNGLHDAHILMKSYRDKIPKGSMNASITSSILDEMSAMKTRTPPEQHLPALRISASHIKGKMRSLLARPDIDPDWFPVMKDQIRSILSNDPGEVSQSVLNMFGNTVPYIDNTGFFRFENQMEGKKEWDILAYVHTALSSYINQTEHLPSQRRAEEVLSSTVTLMDAYKDESSLGPGNDYQNQLMYAKYNSIMKKLKRITKKGL